MIAPNKVIALDESVLSHLAVVLRAASDKIDVLSLYELVAHRFESIDEFILTLDTLFVLGKININFATRTLTYAY